MKKLTIPMLSAAMCAALLWSEPTVAQTQVRTQVRTRTQVPPTAQPVPAEIAGYAAQYVKKAGGNAALYYGRHQGAMPNLLESMYLRQRNSDEFDENGLTRFPRPVSIRESYGVGDIFYDGVLYPEVPMRLDLYRDQLVVAQPWSLSVVGIVVDAERFGWADLRGYRVIYLPTPVAPTDLPSGYYLQLNDGANRVLKRERFGLDAMERNFASRTIRYYVEKEGVFHNVKRSKGSVLRLLKEYRAELNRYIHARRIRVRQDTERALVEIVGEYERLNETGR